MSTLKNESDQWMVEVEKDAGPIYRKGLVTVENGGRIETRSLWLKAVSLSVESGGTLTLDGKGSIAGK